MKFTLNWLKKHLETAAGLEEIVEKLTAIGLEVEEVVDKSSDLKPFKIAQILEAEPHPDADKLSVCKVDTGTEQIQIVCGAPNARAGINVVLAPVGSVIPTNGMKIKASKIRGVESSGMLCSAAELGLGEDHSGIIELPACNDNIAKTYAEIAGFNDPVIEIAITPNRGDCLGVYGIARDLAAAGLGKLKNPHPNPLPEGDGTFKSPLSISITDEKECPMFVGRYFKGVKNSISPDWLQSKLIAIGLKPISALVDITNYIAFEFGRPLHVYDAEKLNGNLVVRPAQNGEKLQALDDKEYELESGMTVIADDKNVQALGGIIGGSLSGCSDDTSEVFLEVALFDPVSVARSGRKLDILTDSRYRFERNVDPAFVMAAAEITSKMIIDLCGGEASELVIAGSEPKWQREIEFDFSYIKQRGGVDVSEQESVKILESLGFSVSPLKMETSSSSPLQREGVRGRGSDGETYNNPYLYSQSCPHPNPLPDGEGTCVISIPSWRSDVEGKADIVEEIVRIYGYDKIPTTNLPSSGNSFEPVLSHAQKRVSNARRRLAARGMVEAVTWSFMKGDTAELFGGGKLKLQNPISSDLDTMRPSILPNLLEALGRNNDRGYENLALFEIGLIFENTSLEGQRQVATGIRSGKTSQKDIYGMSRDVDLFDAKADCLAALDSAGIPVSNLRITTDAASWYHPGRSGVLRLGKTILGVFGEIHPKILKDMDVKPPVAAFELFFDNIPVAKQKKTKAKLEVSEYQSSTRDFAFLIDESVAADDILRNVRGCDKKLIEEVSLFDVYQGKGIDEGKKSVAISVRIQASDHTLTEQELDGISARVIEVVGKVGGVLR